MKYARKTMISAPADNVTRAIQNILLSRNPTRSKLQNLEGDTKGILARTDLPDDAKLSLYQQTLRQYLQYDHVRKTEPVSVTMSTPAEGSGRDSEDQTSSAGTTNGDPAILAEDDLTPQILESVPKMFQRKAKLLMNSLKHNDVMTWKKRVNWFMKETW